MNNFPNNITPLGLIANIALSGGLTYLFSRYIMSDQDPEKWAVFGAISGAGWYAFDKWRE